MWAWLVKKTQLSVFMQSQERREGAHSQSCCCCCVGVALTECGGSRGVLHTVQAQKRTEEFFYFYFVFCRSPVYLLRTVDCSKLLSFTARAVILLMMPKDITLLSHHVCKSLNVN